MSDKSNNNSCNKKEQIFQYASTAPSVSNILNLAQVQNKTKTSSTGLIGGLKAPGKPVALGLGPTVNKPLQGSLKLTTTAKVTVSPAEPSKINLQLETAKVAESVEAKKETFEKKESNFALKGAKVGKPKKSEKALKSSSNNLQHVTENHFDPSHWRLFVGNLGPEVSETLLYSFFHSTYPSTSKALIIRDPKSQKSKGYGFVAFAEGKEFLRALKEMNGKWLGNRQCIIKKSDHQPKFL